MSLMRIFALAALALFAPAVPLSAQITGGSFTGLVTDATGAVIADAPVEARNVATNVASTTVTTQSGYYEFPLLPAGRYVLTVQKEGFQKAVTTELVLNSGTRPRIDLMLKVGDLTQTVEVVSATPLVNATSQSLGVVVDSQKVTDLPLNGRTFTQLLILQPGVSLSGGNANRGGVELNGSSGLGNNWLMDGVDMSFGENNGVGLGGVGGAGAVINTISVEALEEFKTTTNAFSAEYGRATGGVIALTTKSGTNSYHGTLLYFLRNDKLDASNYFANRAGLAKPPLRHNQYGGNFGGPIKRDKLFFFYNYEGAIIRRGRTITGGVPTPAFLNQVTNQTLRKHLEGLPNTFEPTSNPFIGQHFRNDRQKVNENTHLWRADYNLAAHRISGRYNWNYQDVLNPEIRVNLYRAFPLRQKNLMLSDYWVASPRIANEMRFGFNRVGVVRAPADGRQRPGNPNGGGYASIPGIAGTDVQDQLGSFTTNWTGLDNLSFIRGAHTMKMGFEVRRMDSRREQFGSARVFYNSLQDAIIDNPFQVEMYFGNPSGGYTSTAYSAYFQDDWKVNRRLQVNLGLRYEYYTPLRGSIGIATRDPFGPRGQRGDPIWDPDRNNFGPRFGLVFDARGNGKTILRAGAGVTYIAPQPFFFYDASWLDARVPFAPLVPIVDIPDSLKPVKFPFPESFVASVRSNPSLVPRGLAPGLLVPDRARRDEYALQSNLSVQQEVTSTLAVQASYVFNRGLKLYTSRLLNPINPATGRRDIGQDIGAAWFQENGARMWYHALQLSVDKRMSKGLSLNVYYTFSKGMQYHNADNSFVRDSITQDFNNIAGSVGPKVTNVPHRFQTVWSYALPAGAARDSAVGRFVLAGWTAQSIIGWRSGFPLNIVTGRDNIGNGRPDGQRPDSVAGQDQYIDSADRLLRLNRNAYDSAVVQRERRFGTLGYNTVSGLGAFTWDGSLSKVFQINEHHRVSFRFEAFNWLNHTALGNPSSNLSDGNFGRITGIAVEPRNIQFGLKYNF